MEDQADLLAEKTLRAKCSAGMYNFSPKARNMRRRLDNLESLLVEAYSLPRRDPRKMTVRNRMSESIQEFTLHAFQVDGYRCRLPFIRLFFSILLPNKDKPSSHEILFIPEWDSSAQSDQQEQEDGIFKYPLILFRATDKAMHVVEQWLEQAFDCYLVNLSFQRPVMEGLLEDWKFHLVDTPPTEDMRIKVPNSRQKEIAGVTIEYEFKEAELSQLRFTFGIKQIIDIHKKLSDNKLTLIEALESHLHRVVRIKVWKLKMARITLDDFSIQHDGTLKFINGLPRTNLIRYLKRLTSLEQSDSRK